MAPGYQFGRLGPRDNLPKGRRKPRGGLHRSASQVLGRDRPTQSGHPRVQDERALTADAILPKGARYGSVPRTQVPEQTQAGGGDLTSNLFDRRL